VRQLDAQILTVRPGLVMVKRYKRPEKTESGIYLPQMTRHDKSWTLWDVVKVGRPKKGDDSHLSGMLQQDDIVHTRAEIPVDCGYCDLDGRNLLFFKFSQLVGMQRWK